LSVKKEEKFRATWRYKVADCTGTAQA